MARVFMTYLLLFFLIENSLAQSDYFYFEQITKDQGLASNDVRCIIQDSKGFMWFGTRSGLTKYDGYNFINYRSDPINSHNISSSGINSIFEDHRGNLWIGTRRGLNLYDRKNDHFIQFLKKDNNRHRLTGNWIKTIYEDSKGNIWIGTIKNGISCIKKSELDIGTIDSTLKFINYTHDPADSSSISSNNINSFCEDSLGNIWIGMQFTGINRFNPVTTKFKRFRWVRRRPNGNECITSSVVTKICLDPDSQGKKIWIFTEFSIIELNVLNEELRCYFDLPYKGGASSVLKMDENTYWCGTSGEGLFKFNTGTKKLNKIQNNIHNPGKLKHTWITDLYKDNCNRVWIATLGGGVYKYDRLSKKIPQFRVKINTADGDKICQINDIWEDLSSDRTLLWLATPENGLISINKKTGLSQQYNLPRKQARIFDIYQDSEDLNTLWLATWGGALFKFDIIKHSFQNFLFQFDWSTDGLTNINSIYNNELSRTICKDKAGNIWLGTVGGLFKIDPANMNFKPFLPDINNPKSISSRDIMCITEGRLGHLWIGTLSGGLNKFDPETELFTRYNHDPVDTNSIGHDFVSAVLEDSKKRLWVVAGRGLDLFDREKEIFIHYNNIPETITGIIEDDFGTLWLSTRNELVNFNPDNNKIEIYDKFDGFQGDDKSNSIHKSQNGQLYFGGSKGFNAFYPDQIKKNENIPPVILTDFQIFNKSVKPGSESPLKAVISETNEITLNHNQSVFSFEFTALNYSAPAKNQFAYKMEGVDPEWAYTDASRRFATYTQLDPGEYIFRVKGSNNDGIWNEEGTSINIIIKPPWWQTSWAYTFYALFILVMVYGTWRFQINRFKMRHQLELEHQQAQKLEEIDKIKSQFFTNVSHEFRTPLTLIKGPSKLILDKVKDEEIKENATLIYRNSENLSKLVNQLLDISKIEAGEMLLKASKINIVPVIKDLSASFAAYAETKKIKLGFNSTEQNITVYLDIDKFEKIINNILSNALKYTAENGEITLSVGQSDNFVNVKITDTGIGVPEDMLPFIFDRFYQTNQNQNHDVQGSGIGLALTKELVTLHKGNIEVDSKEGEGTTFTISFPLGKKHLQPDQIIDFIDKKDNSESEVTFDESKSTVPKKQSIEIENILNENETPLILIVEDNEDVRQYTKNYLKDFYQIVEAIDGEDGFKKSIDHLPEVIVSDVMMPKMDGFQLIDKLKNDQRTSHIPVILLTAKATSKDKMEGYEYGADDYIMKPFDVQELNVRIKNIIDQRKRLRQHFQKEALFSLENKEIPSIDKMFLDKAINVINSHLSDTSFGVDLFASELAMNRVSLYKKTISLVGDPPGELIKRIRLSNAANLIKNKAGNISEIALEVGFTNPAYFSECFKKQFGAVPSKY